LAQYFFILAQGKNGQDHQLFGVLTNFGDLELSVLPLQYRTVLFAVFCQGGPPSRLIPELGVFACCAQIAQLRNLRCTLRRIFSGL